MHRVFMGIGGNLGDKRLNFKKVHLLIEKELGRIVQKSSVYETSPWGFPAKKNFWNQVVQVETLLEPEELLAGIKQIEDSFGRKRQPGYYLSREMDIDVIYFDDRIIKTEDLIIPHPLLAKRLFVLIPLAEIASEFQHPVLKQSNKQLLESCNDTSKITKIISVYQR
jgi:2-amino-4-hydroxy-6-hydroxymethyldihydropteridine diphosphokinase